MMATRPDILIQEVAPRDGLQIEAKWVETGDKIRLINSLSAIGFGRIEVSSFVSPAAVPSLRDAADVFAGIERRPARSIRRWSRTGKAPSWRWRHVPTSSIS
jgi:hydroxymethylglutaryl-CoA lyase